MRLALNGWPPLASHMAALLVGGAISGFMRPAPDESGSRLPPRTLVITLPDALKRLVKQRHELAAKSGSTDKAPAFVFVRAGADGRPLCRLSSGAWRPFGKDAAALQASYDQAQDVAQVVSLLRKRDVVSLADEPAARPLAACSAGPKVFYGNPEF